MALQDFSERCETVDSIPRCLSLWQRFVIHTIGSFDEGGGDVISVMLPVSNVVDSEWVVKRRCEDRNQAYARQTYVCKTSPKEYVHARSSLFPQRYMIGF